MKVGQPLVRFTQQLVPGHAIEHPLSRRPRSANIIRGGTAWSTSPAVDRRPVGVRHVNPPQSHRWALPHDTRDEAGPTLVAATTKAASELAQLGMTSWLITSLPERAARHPPGTPRAVSVRAASTPPRRSRRPRRSRPRGCRRRCRPASQRAPRSCSTRRSRATHPRAHGAAAEPVSPAPITE